MRNPKRTFFIGTVVWLLFFGGWLNAFLFKNWHFHLFSSKSWHYLFNEFRHGWQIVSISDWIFILSLILAPVIFIFLWYSACKRNWKKIWKKIWAAIRWPFLSKRRKRLKQSIATYTPKQRGNSSSTYRPQAMPKSTPFVQQAPTPSTTFLNNSTAMGSFSSEATPPTKEFDATNEFPSAAPAFEPPRSKHETFTNKDFEEMANTPISDIQIPQMEPAKEDLHAILEQAGYTFLPSPASGKIKVLLAASAQELCLMLCDSEKGDWLADEESFNDEDPLWFSETDHRVSPVFQLKTWSNQLQQKLGDMIKVRPILIEQSGVIINAEDMLKTWNDLGVTVCRTAEGGPVELPTATEIFKEPQEKISSEVLESLKTIL